MLLRFAVRLPFSDAIEWVIDEMAELESVWIDGSNDYDISQFFQTLISFLKETAPPVIARSFHKQRVVLFILFQWNFSWTSINMTMQIISMPTGMQSIAWTVSIARSRNEDRRPYVIHPSPAFGGAFFLALAGLAKRFCP